MECFDTPYPEPLSAVPVLRPPLPVALALSCSEQSDARVIDAILTAMSEQEVIIELPSSDEVFHELQDAAKSCCLSFKDDSSLPDPMLIEVISINPKPPITSPFFTVHCVFSNPSPQDARIIRKYLPAHGTDGNDDDELPSEADMDTIRDLATIADKAVAGAETADTRKAMPVSVPVNFAVTFPEKSIRPIIREGKIVTMNARGAMLETMLSTAEYRALLQSNRRCCIQFRGNSDLPESLAGKTVLIKPYKENGELCYRIGLVYQNTPVHAARKVNEYLATLFDRELEGRHPIKQPLPIPPPQRHVQTRRRPRLTFPIPVKLTLFEKQNANRPLVYGAVIQDLTEYGAMVVAEIDEEIFHLLRRESIEGFLSFGKTHLELPERLMIKIVWIREDEAPGRKYRIGVSFKHASRSTANAVRQFIMKSLEETAQADPDAEGDFENHHDTGSDPDIPQDEVETKVRLHENAGLDPVIAKHAADFVASVEANEGMHRLRFVSNDAQPGVPSLRTVEILLILQLLLLAANLAGIGYLVWHSTQTNTTGSPPAVKTLPSPKTAGHSAP